MLTPQEIVIHGLLSGMCQELEFINTPDKGRGIAPTNNINKGEYICEYKYDNFYVKKER